MDNTTTGKGPGMYDLMLAKKAPLDLEDYKSPRYVMEPKVDGMRLGATVENGNVTFYSRTHKTQDGKLPHLEVALRVPGRNFTIDGEVVALASLVDTPQGVAPLGDFNITMRVMGANADKAASRQVDSPLVFLAFDILSLDGRDVQGLPESQRRDLLERLVADMAFVSVLPRFVPDMETYVAYTVAGGEGMMVKDTQASYIGKRRAAWLKVKVEMTEDAVITGFKPGQGKFSDTIGAILFSQYDAAGNLVERGACSGMDDKTRYAIGAAPEAYLGQVIEFKHFGYASEAEVEGFRHPVFVQFRHDKDAKDCVIDA